MPIKNAQPFAKKEEVKKGCKNAQDRDYRVINSRISNIRTHFSAFELTIGIPAILLIQVGLFIPL